LCRPGTTQPTPLQASCLAYSPLTHNQPSGEQPFQKQMNRAAQSDNGYARIDMPPLVTIDSPNSDGAGSTRYYPSYNESSSSWVGQPTYHHKALVRKAATTNPYSLDDMFQSDFRQYAINQPFFSSSSSGPPSMARSDGSASSGVIPPPQTIPNLARVYGIANPEDEIKYTGSMDNRVFTDPELCGEDDGVYEPDTDIYLDEYAGPSLGFAPPSLQF
jgi:hypothetical protein